MNKKLFFGAMAAAAMLLTTACSNEEPAAASGSEANVNFSIALEKGMGTRAISDGLQAKKLVYAIYDANGALIQTLDGSTNGQFVNDAAFPGGLTDNVTVTLAKGQAYTAVFWAQNAACTAYDTSDLEDVTVDYAGDNNDETRDAFFAAKTFTVTGDAELEVTLKRPFAQINVGVEQDDWNAAVAAKFEVEKSSVTVKNAATSINLITGATAGTAEVTYNLAAIPGEDLYADADADGVKEAYKWLSMSYILPADESEDGASKTTLESLGYTFAPKAGTSITFGEGLTTVPVQRNWRTNILGRILSSDIKFNIVIDPAFDGDYNNSANVATADEMKAAISDPMITEITLAEDLTLTENVVITSDKTIDLGGKTLTTRNIQTYAPLSFENGKIETADGMAVRCYANGDLSFDNVEITITSQGNAIELGYNRNGVVDCGNAKLTVKNTTINSASVGILIHGANNDVTIENSTINHKWFGITQNGLIPGSTIKVINTNIFGTYSGIYLSNYAGGEKNTLIVEGGSIHSDEESAIEVKKTDITVTGTTLSAAAATQSYSLNGGGSNGIGYGIVLAGYKTGVAYEGTTNFTNVTYNLAAGADAIKVLKYNGTEGERME